MGDAAYIISAAGIPNYGDEVILRTWLRHLGEHQPDRDIWVDCPEPGRAAILMRNVNPRARFVNTLWHLSRRSPSSGYTTIREFTRTMIDRLGTPELDSGLIVLRDAGSVHIVGGGYLNEMWPENLAFIAAAAHLAESRGIPAFLTGAGLMPCEPATAALLRPDVAAFTLAEARDAASAALVGIPLGWDDAVLRWQEVATGDPDEAPDIMILIQGDLGAANVDEDAEAAVVAEFVAAARARGGRTVGFIEGYPQFDGRRWSRYREEYPDAAFLSFEFLWETGLPARSGQQWLTTRFHFHLLAAAYGADGLAMVSDQDYYAQKHALLDEWGTGWPLVGLVESRSGLPEPARDLGFDSVLHRAHRDKSAVAATVYPPSTLAPTGWRRALRRKR
ncbi:polysaccharide pyruvyl transferase family protein [Microcella flavibacter]|uniref:polysaccharide pyruvyl transferase family protein n=1 Tax=Microcella flavibacter TaxID=1804990 RepID=UPI0014572259|nr:polysaccharide pyruvyl transferase family protein [Microcella flavibacter]